MKAGAIVSGGFFVPAQLVGRLSGMAGAPAAFVEAPSGFGKTTAVREFLRARGARALWHTCLGEPAARSWGALCRMLSEFAPEAAASLAALVLPTRENLADAAAIVRGIAPEHEVFIVVDNYQLFRSELRREIMEVFSMHGGGLHMVFISQPLDFSSDVLGWGHILRVTAKDFLFDRESTAELCRLCSAGMDDEGVDYVQRLSGGWVAAIRLQADNYRDCGEFARYEEISQLIDAAVWRRLNNAGRAFMMTAALPGRLPDRLVGHGVRELLLKNPFVVYSASDGFFHMHELMRRFLRARLDVSPPDFRRTALTRAAALCAEEGELFEAARLYADAGDYKAVFSLPFTNSYFYGADRDTIAFFAIVCDGCPADVLTEHHAVLPLLAYQFFKNGMTHVFSRLLSVMRSLAGEGSPLSGTELRRLRGEYELILSFLAYNDIAEMSAHHRRAYEELKAVADPPRSAVFSNSIPIWTWRVPSLLSLFWRERGGLDASLPVMDECVPIYAEITGGQGSGGASLMRADALLNRGDAEGAAAFCRRALYEARPDGQYGNCICAEFTLARAAILLGDRELFTGARGMIEKDAFEGRLRGVLAQMGETALCAIDAVCGSTSSAPDRMRSVEEICRTQYIQAQPFALSVFALIMLRERKYSELYAMSELLSSLCEKLHYQLPRLYLLICMAGAKLGEGKAGEASALLADALAAALPDRVYLPFAENFSYIAPLLEHAAAGKSELEEILDLCRRHHAGAKLLASEARAGQALTPRQREIAMLLREGYSAKEAAARLFVAESTVASARKIIYEKLGIHSCKELKAADI